MPTIDERISELKAQGKTESSSKSLAKLVREQNAGGGNRLVYGQTGLTDPVVSSLQKGMAGSGGASSFDFGNADPAYAQAANIVSRLTQPALNTLGSGISSLQNRYQDLISSIKGSQKVAENQQTSVTGQELAKRGILPSSTAYQQEIANALSPVRAQYAQMAAETGLGAESERQNLLNTIANLQSGMGTDTLSLARSMIGDRPTPKSSLEILQEQLLTNAINRINQEDEKKTSSKDQDTSPLGIQLWGGLAGLE